MFSAVTLAIGATIAAYLTMLGEWGLSRANERHLRAEGAIEPADDVYRTMAWAYPLSFLAIGIECALSGPPSDVSLLAGAAVFFAAKGLKLWAIASLGTRWTFRVLVPPGSALVTRGPYSWLRHPNYVAVLGELAGFGVLLAAPFTGAAAVIGFALLIHRRIAVEERALGIAPPAA